MLKKKKKKKEEDKKKNLKLLIQLFISSAVLATSWKTLFCLAERMQKR
jgi:hypothetical protein